MKTGRHGFLKIAAAAVLSIVAFMVFCRLCWLQPYRDIMRCMEPTVKAGDLFLVNRLSYVARGPERGDVVLPSRRGSASANTIRKPQGQEPLRDMKRR